MRARRVLVLLAVALIAGSCTSISSTTASPTAASPPPTSAVPPSPTVATLADGSVLPSGCTGKPVPSETAAFVADGRAWALDPHDGRLACLFRVRQPGAFAFGPQGDRVMLAGLGVVGVPTGAPTWPPVGPTP